MEGRASVVEKAGSQKCIERRCYSTQPSALMLPEESRTTI
jgi:hypothetical protein